MHTCVSFGGHLLEIETQSEQIWLKGKGVFKRIVHVDIIHLYRINN